MYAIVDIETTGGYPGGGAITEVAIVLHDGVNITSTFHSLINPKQPVPRFISSLTGIHDEMLRDAPDFGEVAGEIHRYLNGRVFVAHNVNFDYSFLKYNLAKAGYELQCKKLCTVRLSRSVFPGLPSYRLGRLCRSLEIPIVDEHRAGGDAEATALLFAMILANDREGHVQRFLNRNSSEQLLPPNLPRQYVDSLPLGPGVYYFHDAKGKVIYVGKAKSLKKRVVSHFTGSNYGRQRQEFLRNIYSVSFQTCGTELMAFILEAVEIKKLWPLYNRSMKRFEQSYGLYAFEDQRGYIRLAIDKKNRHSAPYYTFNNFADGMNRLNHLMKDFSLCPKLCFFQRNGEMCVGQLSHHCQGACEGLEPQETYNQRVQEALRHLKETLPSFGILDSGREQDEKSLVLLEEGKFYGMGYFDTELHPGRVKEQLTQYPSNDYICNLVIHYAHKYPEKKVLLSEMNMSPG